MSLPNAALDRWAAGPDRAFRSAKATESIFLNVLCIYMYVYIYFEKNGKNSILASLIVS